jgi:phage terminase large subunit
MSSINISDKFEPLFDIPEGVDTFILTGGRYSQKSFAVSTASLSACAKYGHRVLYSRYTNASLKDSIYAEVEEKLDILNYRPFFNATINRIDSNFNDSKVVFKGLKAGSNQQTANLKGLKDFSMWVLDEAEELVDESIYDKIFLSIRGNKKTDEHKNIKMMILNPASKEHFIYKKYFLKKGVEGGWNGIKDNVCYIHTTYLDCLEFVPDEIKVFFEEMKRDNPKKYYHIVLGGWLDKAEGVVFQNWKFGEFNPDKLQTSCGMDFGFSVDPDTITEVVIDKKHKKIYLKELLYKNGLKTEELVKIVLDRVGSKLIIADSAEPRLIADLKSKGVNIKAVKKGTIESGITMMLDYEIIVEPNSSNIAKELNNYVYSDKNSKLYVDDWNHAIDGSRYNIIYHLDNPNKGKYNIR